MIYIDSFTQYNIVMVNESTRRKVNKWVIQPDTPCRYKWYERWIYYLKHRH